MFIDNSVSRFLDQLASAEPVPGGGSASALAAALAAALVSMVCNLTVGKKRYQENEAVMQEVLTRAEALRGQLTDLIEADTEAYGAVMGAYRLSRETPGEREMRAQEIEAALKEAAIVPLNIATCCGEIVELALPAAELGNKWAVSDAGVAALLAEASLHSALLNVDINLASIQDSRFVEMMRSKIEVLTRDQAQHKEAVLKLVHERIKAQA